MEMMDRLAKLRTGHDGPSEPADEQARKSWPYLFELLTCRVVMSDQAILPAKLTIEAGLGCWAVSVYHPSLAMGLGTTSSTLQGAFDAIEGSLERGTDWRASAKTEPRLKPLPEKKGKGGRQKRS